MTDSPAAPSIIQIVIPPSQGNLLGSVRGELLAGALARRLRRRVVVTMADTYEQLSELLDAGRHHAFWVPPRLRAKAEQVAFAILCPVRGASSRYCAALVSRRDSRHSGGVLPGARAAWVSESSAAGCQLALEHLRSEGVVPVTFFSAQRHEGSYRLALEAVLDGSADVTSIYATRRDEAAVRTALAEHVGERELELLPIAFTDWTPSDVMVVTRTLPECDAARLALALLELSRDDSHDSTLRELLQAQSLSLVAPPVERLLAAARREGLASAAMRPVADPWFLELDDQGSVGERGAPAAAALETSLGADGAAQVRALARRVISSQAPAQIEFRYAGDAGVESWRAEAAPWGDAAAPRALVALRNVTAQREGEQELVRMGSFPVLDPSPTIELGLDGAVQFANPAARRSFPDLLELGARHPIVVAAVTAHRTNGGQGPAQVEYAHGDRHFELSVSRIDELRSLRVFTIDVTERKKMEATLVRTDRLVSLGTICAGVGHEINNPLAYVLANLEFVSAEVAQLRGTAPAESDLAGVVEALEDTRKGVERIATIVGDIKALSRGTADQAAPVDVRAVLESTLRMAASQLRGHATLVREFSDVPTVDADETRLGQVFLNLVVNAIHAMKHAGGPGHVLTVTTRADSARRVLVEIKDTGGGIPASVAARLFEPFFTTKAAGVGTGLGLSISRSIIAGFGGSLAFDTEPGGGTTFRVTLPASQLGAQRTTRSEPRLIEVTGVAASP